MKRFPTQPIPAGWKLSSQDASFLHQRLLMLAQRPAVSSTDVQNACGAALATYQAAKGSDVSGSTSNLATAADVTNAVAPLATSAAVSALQTVVNAVQAALLTVANVVSAVGTALANYGAAKTTDVSAAQAAILAGMPTVASGTVQEFDVTKVPAGWTKASYDPLAVMVNGFAYGTTYPFGGVTGSFITGIAGAIPTVGNPKLYALSPSFGFSSYDVIAQTWQNGLAGRPSAPGASLMATIPVATTQTAIGAVAKPANSLIISLYNSSGQLQAFLYDVNSGLWTSGATCSVAKNLPNSTSYWFDSTGLKLYVFGGGTADIVYYDIQANTWTTVTATLSLGSVSRTCVLPSGKFLIVDLTNWIYYLFDPVAATVSASTPMPFAKGGLLAYAAWAGLEPTAAGANWFQGDVLQSFVEGTGWASQYSWSPLCHSNPTTIPGVGTFFIYLNQITYSPVGNQIITTVKAVKN